MRCRPSSENSTVSGATCSTQGEKASASSRRREPGQTALSTRRGDLALSLEIVAPWDRVVSPSTGQWMQANMEFHRLLSGGFAGGDLIVHAVQKFGAAAAGFEQ